MFNRETGTSKGEGEKGNPVGARKREKNYNRMVTPVYVCVYECVNVRCIRLRAHGAFVQT